MKNTTLLKNMRELGYPLFETEKSLDANKILAEVVKSKEPRLLEGFPLLLVNSLERNLFDYRKARKHLKSTKEREYFRKLVIMSLALYKYLGLKLSLADTLYQSSLFNKELFNKFFCSFKNKQNSTRIIGQLSSDRLVNTFKNYFKHAESDHKNYLNMKDEFDLEYALSQIFSKKQKELFMKKLKSEKMSKTEYEYFSRSVKKKVQALANTDLHKLATRLVKE